MRRRVSGLLLLVGVAVWVTGLPPARAQFMGVLTTPITVATIARTNAATEGIVAAQGANVKIRLLGFFLTADRMMEIQFQDSAGTACTGRLVIATGGALNVPVQPPGYVCETGANRRLDLRTGAGGGNAPGVLGGALMWQPAQ